MLLYRGNTDGTYSAGVNYSTSNNQDPNQYAGTFLIVDVDGDGRDDFIVKWKSNTDGVRFLVYRGTASGWFLNAVRVVPSTNIPYYNAA